MNPHVAFGMILGRLRDSLHLFHFRQQRAKQSRLIEQLKCLARRALHQQSRQFVAQPLGGNVVNLRGRSLDGCKCDGFDAAAESRGDGKVVVFTQDPAFRLFWRGTMPLLLDAVLYGPSM